MMSTGKLQGKVVIVTGGGSGFGQGIVTKFIQEGAKVVLVDINEENGANVAKAQPAGSAVFVQGDVSCEADWVKTRDATLSQFGRIDVVVNNAGIVNKATVCYLRHI